MGQLSKAIEEFQNVSNEYYEKLKNILENEYCWKCPMRSTSSTSQCREVHAWRNLEQGLDAGIKNDLRQNGFSSLKTEALATKVRMKNIKKNGGSLKELTIAIKVDKDENCFFPKNSWLIVKINPKRVRIGDQVLISKKNFNSQLVGSCALLAGFPFHLESVEKFFHKGGIRYLKTIQGFIPLNNILGVLIKVIYPNDAKII